jgi:CheY-like chemotaxis protein
MDMSEVTRRNGTAMPASPTTEQDASDTRWPALFARIGQEIAGPLTAALERVNTLNATGRIERPSLRMLRQEVEDARRAAMVGQQLARYAAGPVRQSHERVALARLLDEVMAQHDHEAHARKLQLRKVLKPAEVIVDPSLLYSLLNTLLDWALMNATTAVEVSIDQKAWPAPARIQCSFSFRAAGDTSHSFTSAAKDRLDCVAWHLVHQIAQTMGLLLSRVDTGGLCTVALEFPRTVNREVEGLSSFEFDLGFSPSLSSRPLAGSHVLVLASRREVRTQVREAISNLGLIVDFVASVEEAREFCRSGLPHAIVYESALEGERFQLLHHDVHADAPDMVFVEIVEEGNAYEVSGFNGATVARVGRDALATGLPSALVFELSKGI